MLSEEPNRVSEALDGQKVQHGFVVNPPGVKQFRMGLQQGFGGRGIAYGCIYERADERFREISHRS